MTYKIVFTPSAREQFLSALAYIREDDPSAALAFRHKAGESLSRLRQFPESGHVLPEFPQLPFREVIVLPYRFFYSAKGDAVWVVAMWHGAQLPDEPPDVTGGQAAR